MSSTDAIRDRYQCEPALHGFVDFIVGVMLRGDLTPQDIARGVNLAAVIFAERYDAPVAIIIREDKDPHFIKLADELRARHSDGRLDEIITALQRAALLGVDP